MASDEDYAAFLDKANQDLGGSKPAPTQSVGTQSVNTDVPKALQQVEEYYVSDADEPFEPVSLKWDGQGIPSEGMHCPDMRFPRYAFPQICVSLSEKMCFLKICFLELCGLEIDEVDVGEC